MNFSSHRFIANYHQLDSFLRLVEVVRNNSHLPSFEVIVGEHAHDMKLPVDHVTSLHLSHLIHNRLKNKEGFNNFVVVMTGISHDQNLCESGIIDAFWRGVVGLADCMKPAIVLATWSLTSHGRCHSVSYRSKRIKRTQPLKFGKWKHKRWKT